MEKFSGASRLLATMPLVPLQEDLCWIDGRFLFHSYLLSYTRIVYDMTVEMLFPHGYRMMFFKEMEANSFEFYYFFIESYNASLIFHFYYCTTKLNAPQ
jgi:hypothetical protein